MTYPPIGTLFVIPPYTLPKYLFEVVGHDLEHHRVRYTARRHPQPEALEYQWNGPWGKNWVVINTDDPHGR